METPLHSIELTMWWVLSTSGIAWLIISTVIIDRYLHVLQKVFLQFIKEMAVNFWETFFFFSRTRFGYTLRKQYWTYLMKSLAIEYCLIDCLKFADVSGSRQHALLIWTFINSCVLWNMYFQQWNLRRINKGAHIKTLRFNFD